MDFLISLLVFLHIVCWAIAAGLWISAARTRRPNKGIVHASAGALVFGIIMMAILMATGVGGHLWFTLKLLFALITTIFSFIAIKKNEQTPAVVWFGIPTAIGLNIIVAVFGIGR